MLYIFEYIYIYKYYIYIYIHIYIDKTIYIYIYIDKFIEIYVHILLNIYIYIYNIFLFLEIYIYIYVAFFSTHFLDCLPCQRDVILRMQAHDKAVANPEIPKKKINETIKDMPGYFRCCAYKWKRPRQRHLWTLVCRVAPKLAKSVKEVPDSLRKMMGVASKCSHRTSKADDDSICTLPNEFVDLVAECTVACMQMQGIYSLHERWNALRSSRPVQCIYIYFSYIYIYTPVYI